MSGLSRAIAGAMVVSIGTLGMSETFGQAAPGAAFTPIGDLPGGAFESRTGRMSSDGSAVVGFSAVAGGYHAFRWTADDGLQTLGDLPGGDTEGQAIGTSRGGLIIVGSGRTSNGIEATRWTIETSLAALGDLKGGPLDALACDVSDNGQIVCGVGTTANGSRAFRWTKAGGLEPLGVLPGGESWTFSDAFAISRDGKVVVGVSTSAAGQQAYRWTRQAGMVGLGDLPGGESRSAASAVNRSGSIVGGRSVSAEGQQAFLWTETRGMIGLADPPGGFFGGEVFAISDDGSLAVGYGNQNPEKFEDADAAIWTPTGGVRLLQDVLVRDYGLSAKLAGWRLVMCTGVSSDGRSIAGWGRNPSGNFEGFVVTLPAAAAPACRIDINGDGVLDARDFAAFQNAFALGCP